MKIVVPYYQDIDPVILSNWMNHYQQHVKNIPVTLMHYGNVSNTTKQIWPYELIHIKQDISFLDKFKDQFSFASWWYIDTMRMLAYETCGDCLVVDADAVFVKELNINDIPKCEWGIVPFSTTSYNCIQIYEYNMFDEAKNVKACNAGVQIFRNGYFESYYKLFMKYLVKFQDIALSQGNYGEHINCLTHKINNGVYIQPEWNTMWDDYSIQKPYIKHYYLPKGKERIYNDLKMKFLLSS